MSLLSYKVCIILKTSLKSFRFAPKVFTNCPLLLIIWCFLPTLLFSLPSSPTCINHPSTFYFYILILSNNSLRFISTFWFYPTTHCVEKLTFFLPSIYPQSNNSLLNSIRKNPYFPIFFPYIQILSFYLLFHKTIHSLLAFFIAYVYYHNNWFHFTNIFNNSSFTTLLKTHNYKQISSLQIA